ncbi:Trk system potassium transporter TrkA [Desulforhopalus sp. 52FAK]
MDIILYGTTEIGYLIASQLHKQHNVTLLSDNPELSEKFIHLDISIVEGDGGDIAVLQSIEAKKVRLFIACTPLDEANIVACWTIKKISETETVCFISKASLYNNLSSSIHNKYQTRYDIDSIIWPEQLLTQDIFRIISVPEALDVEYLAGGKAKLFEYKIKDSSTIINTPIMSCNFPPNILIAGISRKDQLFIPNGKTTIQQDDRVFFIGTSEALDSLAADFFKHNNKVNKVSIIGGGSVGLMLCQKLEDQGINVKIIECEQNRCEYLANTLTKTLVLQGDGTDLELLEEEAIADADVCVCTTDNDEKNLLCSLLLKQLGSRRTITRISNPQNYDLFTRVGIDVLVSPKASALTEVHNRIQSHDIHIIALIEGGKGEVLELTVPDSFVTIQLKDFTFPVNAVIGVISRGHKVLIPNGDTFLNPGDQLKIFTMKEDSETIKELFAL